jgi:cystathionine gamma-synthase
MYFGVQVLIREVFARWGLESTFVNMADIEAVKNAMRPNTKLILIETPSNPMISVCDIGAIADIAHNGGAILVCDNTVASPIFQAPLVLGADMVIHATTKYLGGHSDLLGGAVIIKEETVYSQRLQTIQEKGGAVPSAFDCWLLMRGIFTLPYRLAAVNLHALMVAEFLERHPKIERVLHLGLRSHPQYDLAKRQMTGYGGLFSFLVKGGAEEAIALTNQLKLIKRATSFGGVHTTIEHRASIEIGTTTPQNLLRISIGLEHPDDLMDDLTVALDAI